MRNAKNAPMISPAIRPARSDGTLFANHPMSTPAMTPLNVDPMTIPTMSGATSGAEIRADRPSNTPRMPPSTSPSIGFFITPPCRSYYACRARCLSAECVCHEDAHDDVGEHEKDRRAVGTADPYRSLQYVLAMG